MPSPRDRDLLVDRQAGRRLRLSSIIDAWPASITARASGRIASISSDHNRNVPMRFPRRRSP